MEEEPAPKKADPRAAQLRKQADALTAKIAERRREMSQNATPKRMREYRHRVTEGDALARQQKAMHALADAREAGNLPAALEDIRSRSQVAPLVAKVMKHNGGYYDAYFETDQYEDKSAAGKALQSLLEGKTPADAKAEADYAQRRRVEEAENKVRFQKIEGFFPTPKPLIDKMLSEAEIKPGMKVLEPSAGKGDIADAIKSQGANVDTVELRPVLRDILEAKGHNLVGDDFLKTTGQYDRIVMNPPFERGQDAQHVQHAWEQLKPGGKLVAIMSEGTFSRSDRRSAEFRQWLNERGGTSEKIENGFGGKDAFRQTGVASRIVTVEKPSARAAAGKLEALDQWAKKKLEGLGGTGLRGGVPLDPIKDPQRLVLLGIRGAVHIAKGVNRFAAWSKAMGEDLKDLSGRAIGEVWKMARRLHRMDDDSRDLFVRNTFTVPQSETTKQTIRRVTGQTDTSRAVSELDALAASLKKAQQASAAGYRSGIAEGRARQVADEGYQQAAVTAGYRAGLAAGKDIASRPPEETIGQRVRRVTGQTDQSRSVSESDALAGSMKKAQQASTAGYRAGVEQVTGIKRELARIVRENLPPSERGKMLLDVASVNNVGQLGGAMNKVRGVLANHDVRQALSDLEDLTGKLKTRVYRPPTAKASEAKAKIPGDIDPANLRDIDLARLPPETRAVIRPLLDEARYLKDRLRNAAAGASVDAKLAAVEKFRDIEHQIRVAAANALAEREIVIAGKVQQLHEAVDQTVQAIKAPPKSKEQTSAPPRERSVLKSLWRGQYNPDATIGLLAGEDSPAYDAGIRSIRRAQSNVLGETQKYEKGLAEKLTAAGLQPHTAKYGRWLDTRETLDLPDAGKLELSRPEMLDLYGHSQDAQTKADIENGIGWNFEANRLGRRIKLTPADVEAIAGKLRPEERAIIDWHKKYVNDALTEPAIRAKLAIDQRAPEPIEGYWPRARNLAANPRAELPTEWQQVQKKWLENIPSMKERGHDPRTPIMVRNAIEVMHDFVHDTANLIHLAEPLHSAAAVLQHPEVRGAVERGYGPQLNRQINQYLLDTAGASDRPARTIAEKIAGVIMRNISRAWLTLNPSPMLKNAIPGTISLMPEFDPADLSHGVKEAAKPGAYKRMLDASPVAWNRYEGGGLYGQYSPLLEKRATPTAQLSTVEALKRGKIGAAIDAIPLMKKADAVPFTVAFHAAEHFIDRTQPGLTGEARTQAILDKFHEAVYRTQNGTSSSEISYAASLARQRGPLLQAFLMFQSDANKKLNQFGRWSQLDKSQRARLAVATGLSSLFATGIGYGLKRGASKVGQLAGGAPEDPEQLKRDQHAAAWDIANNTLGLSYLGNTALDLARAARGGDVSLSNPAIDTTNKLLTAVGNLLGASYNAADSQDGTSKAEKAKDRLMNTLVRSQEDIRTAGGDPTVPISRMIQRSFRAARFEPPDPRQEARKAQAATQRDFRGGLPADVTKLLSEKAKLDGLGDNRSPEEDSRRDDLADVHRSYLRMLKARRDGDKGDEEMYRKDMLDAARGVTSPTR
jgi:hypothetical protein